jgi:thiol:disulfide interchange protein
MALIYCSGCGRGSIEENGKCQFCGNALKFSPWTRKLRRKEAYGFLLVCTGCFLLATLKTTALLTLLSGFTMIAFSVFKPRLQFAKTQRNERLQTRVYVI